MTMDVDINELVKRFSEGLNLKDFKGDIVGVKVVENEFGTIEPGGIAVQNNYYGTSQVGSNDTPVDDDAVLESLIFNGRIFDTNAKLLRLRDEIGARIMGARLSDESRFAAERPQIDPKVQKEWYYIWKPLNESGLFARSAKVGVTMFIEQMMKWYPEVFPEHASDDERKAFVKRMVASISAEKSRWVKGEEEVPIKDMTAACPTLGIVYIGRIQTLFFVCNELRKALRELSM